MTWGIYEVPAISLAKSEVFKILEEKLKSKKVAFYKVMDNLVVAFTLSDDERSFSYPLKVGKSLRTLFSKRESFLFLTSSPSSGEGKTFVAIVYDTKKYVLKELSFEEKAVVSLLNAFSEVKNVFYIEEDIPVKDLLSKTVKVLESLGKSVRVVSLKVELNENDFKDVVKRESLLFKLSKFLEENKTYLKRVALVFGFLFLVGSLWTVGQKVYDSYKTNEKSKVLVKGKRRLNYYSSSLANVLQKNNCFYFEFEPKSGEGIFFFNKRKNSVAGAVSSSIIFLSDYTSVLKAKIKGSAKKEEVDNCKISYLNGVIRFSNLSCFDKLYSERYSALLGVRNGENWTYYLVERKPKRI